MRNNRGGLGRLASWGAVASGLVVALASCASQLEGVGVVPVAQSAALTVDPPVVLSQVYGGGGNSGAAYQHDFVELFNRSSAPYPLDGLSIQYASATGSGNFGSNASQVAVLPATTLAPGQYFLVQLAGNQAVGLPLPAPDLPNQTIAVSASAAKLALVIGSASLGCNGGSNPCDATQQARILDLIGFGNANFFEGSATPALSNGTAAIRKRGGCEDSNDNALDFEVSPPAPRNSTTGAAPCGGGDVTPTVASTVPANHATNVSADATVQITFSEPVDVVAPWFTFQCNLSGPITAAITGGPGSSTFELTPSGPFADGEVCTIVVTASAVHDSDRDDPPDTLVADYSFSFTVAASTEPLPVHTIQGAAHLSPYAGQLVHVGPAIVTALRSNGFFMQDEAPDTDDATSEGILVYTSSAPSVSVGARVTVQGTVEEYRPGCSPSCGATTSAFDNLTITELTSPVVNVLDTGHPLPAAVVLGSGVGQRAVPLQVICDDASGSVEAGGAFDPEHDGIDFYESLEGMRVQLDDPQVIDPTRTFSGTPASIEIGVLARGDASLRSARGGIMLRETDANPERLFLSNALVSNFPSVNVGDAFAGPVVGVMDYSFANFKLLVSEPLPNVVAGSLSQETTSLVAEAASQLSVASMNVENLDALDSETKFSELAEIVVGRMRSPDLIALEEVQDNNGPMNNGVVDASATLDTFVTAILGAGGPSYRFRQIDPLNNTDGGQPGGNIRLVFLYRTDRGLSFIDRGSAGALTPTGVFTNTSGAEPHLTLSPGRIEPTHSAWSSSRKPLAGEFSFAGHTFFVIANHFNSKGGDDPLFGRTQPPLLSSEAQRVQQATLVAGFVDELLEADSDAYVIALGDLNDFSYSAPLEILQGVGLVDLMLSLPENERYTYLYQGNSQDLDHILVSPALAPRASYDIVHVNAEFAVQASDHDPAVVRIELGDAPTIITSEPPGAIEAGGALSFQVVATGSPAPTFSLQSAPDGMTIDPASGFVTWTASTVPGDYAFTVAVQNHLGTTTREYSVQVGAAGPTLPRGVAWLLRVFVALCGLLPKLSFI